jgi:hypothetical protein
MWKDKAAAVTFSSVDPSGNLREEWFSRAFDEARLFDKK